MTLPSERKGKHLSFEVPDHLVDAFMETVDGFFAMAHEGTTPAQRAAEIRAQDKDAGIDSLATLLDVALGEAGQAVVIARFLAGLYNGQDFPFALTELRGLDQDLFEHCIAVLRLDHRPFVEVHKYFPDGLARWQAIIKKWGVGMRDITQKTDEVQIRYQTCEANYLGHSNVPGFRDVTLFVMVRTETDSANALGLHLSAHGCEKLAEDLVRLHRFSWNRESERPIDASSSETRPDWL